MCLFSRKIEFQFVIFPHSISLIVVFSVVNPMTKNWAVLKFGFIHDDDSWDDQVKAKEAQEILNPYVMPLYAYGLSDSHFSSLCATL